MQKFLNVAIAGRERPGGTKKQTPFSRALNWIRSVVRACERVVVSELFDTLNNESLGKLHLVIV